MTSDSNRAQALARRVAAVPIDGKHTAADAVSLLVARRGQLAQFRSAEELGEALESDPSLKPIAFHLGRVRAALAYELWAEQIFLGASVLDDLLLQMVQDVRQADPLEAALQFVYESGIHRPGFVVYPLHSLALYGAGLLGRSDLRFSLRGWGLLLTPQTNSRKGAVEFLNAAAARVGVDHRVDSSLIEHWIRSRPIQWLWKNPLIALRVSSFPGDYYENQRLLVSKLEFSASVVYCLAALKVPNESDDVLSNFSSLNGNNWETLDIYHYLVFHLRSRSKTLGGDCVPFTAQRNTLLELCEFSVDINPMQWRRLTCVARRVITAIQRIESGYFKYAIRMHHRDAHARAYRKVASSLRYFRRSFRRSAPDGEGSVSLATAFEALLTDQDRNAITKRLERRIRLLMKGSRGVGACVPTFKDLYDARCRVVHEGTPATLDLGPAQALYVAVLVRFATRLVTWTPSAPCNEPMREIIGDPEH